MKKGFWGDKKKLALEYIINGFDTSNQEIFGHTRLWLKDNYIGSFESDIYFNGFIIWGLRRSKEIEEWSFPFPPMENKNDLLNFLMTVLESDDLEARDKAL